MNNVSDSILIPFYSQQEFTFIQQEMKKFVTAKLFTRIYFDHSKQIIHLQLPFLDKPYKAVLQYANKSKMNADVDGKSVKDRIRILKDALHVKLRSPFKVFRTIKFNGIYALLNKFSEYVVTDIKESLTDEEQELMGVVNKWYSDLQKKLVIFKRLDAGKVNMRNKVKIEEVYHVPRTLKESIQRNAS